MQTTYDLLKVDYYWKNMRGQIANIIKLCEIWARNEREPILNHPAFSQKVGVFGLPESAEGYNDIIVFTDFFTKE